MKKWCTRDTCDLWSIIMIINFSQVLQWTICHLRVCRTSSLNVLSNSALLKKLSNNPLGSLSHHRRSALLLEGGITAISDFSGCLLDLFLAIKYPHMLEVLAQQLRSSSLLYLCVAYLYLCMPAYLLSSSGPLLQFIVWKIHFFLCMRNLCFQLYVQGLLLRVS